MKKEILNYVILSELGKGGMGTVYLAQNKNMENDKVAIKRCNLNLAAYNSVIIITSLWYKKIPSPILRFLEQSTGRIKNVSYVLFNNNKEDHPELFDKMDRILNLRRGKSYFVSLEKKEMHLRVY